VADQAPEVDWVELRTYGSCIDAEMARDFLGGHGVRALLRGNSVTLTVLNGIGSLPDIRLMVAREDVDHAREILEAMEPGPGSDAPYRGRAPG
jgi:hypothetical protein